MHRGCSGLGSGCLMGPMEEAGGECPDTRRPVKGLRRRWGAREREGRAGGMRDSKRTTARGWGVREGGAGDYRRDECFAWRSRRFATWAARCFMRESWPKAFLMPHL